MRRGARGCLGFSNRFQIVFLFNDTFTTGASLIGAILQCHFEFSKVTTTQENYSKHEEKAKPIIVSIQ